jgi:hypothetical protein
VKLKDSVKQYVRTFAIAAATILTACALNSPARAEIVYHSADIRISHGSYNFDLNGDGITDFVIADEALGGCPPTFRVWETPASGNGAIPGPLARGAEIGPSQVFSGAEAFLASVGQKKVWWGMQPCYFGWGGGPDPGAKTGYLKPSGERADLLRMGGATG